MLNCVKTVTDYEMKHSIFLKDLGMKSSGETVEKGHSEGGLFL